MRQAVIQAMKRGDFYDAQGNYYYPSQDEVRELHRIHAALKRGEHVPGLA